MRKIMCGILALMLSRHLYANLTKIVEIDRNTDVVVCEDCNGNLWEFSGAEDWQVGDECNLVMFDCGTEEIADDVIIRETYERSDLL